jgi:hypothetical protein
MIPATLVSTAMAAEAGLGRQALAALSATAGENSHAARGFHALAEPMPALAHKLARLIRALHGTLRLVNAAGC